MKKILIILICLLSISSIPRNIVAREHTRLLYNQAVHSQLMMETDKAIALYEAVILSNHISDKVLAGAYNNLAVIYHEKNRQERANRDPNIPEYDAFWDEDKYGLETEDYKIAKKLYIAAMQLDCDNKMAAQNLQRLYNDKNKEMMDSMLKREGNVKQGDKDRLKQDIMGLSDEDIAKLNDLPIEKTI